MYCTNSRGSKAPSWSCNSGLDLDLGLVSFGLGLVVLVLVLVLRIWSCSHHWFVFYIIILLFPRISDSAFGCKCVLLLVHLKDQICVGCRRRFVRCLSSVPWSYLDIFIVTVEHCCVAVFNSFSWRSLRRGYRSLLEKTRFWAGFLLQWRYSCWILASSCLPLRRVSVNIFFSATKSRERWFLLSIAQSFMCFWQNALTKKDSLPHVTSGG